MSSVSRLLSTCACALALGACKSSSLPVVCTPNWVFGLQVAVVDSLTNALPPSATLIARSGAYVDSVEAQAPPFAEVPGTVFTLSAAGNGAERTT